MSEKTKERVGIAIDHIYRLGAGALLAMIAWFGSEMREGIKENTNAIHSVEKRLTDVYHLEVRLGNLETKEANDAQKLQDRVRQLELELARNGRE